MKQLLPGRGTRVLEQGGRVRPSRVNHKDLGAEQKKVSWSYTKPLHRHGVALQIQTGKNDHCSLFRDLSRHSARPDHHNVFIIVPRVMAIISLTRVTVADIGTTGHGRFPSCPCPATAVIRADF